MKNKKLILAVIAFVALIGVALGVYFATRPETVAGAKAYSITVVHKDGTTKEFSYRTDAEYLGDALVEAGLIAGKDGPYGLDVSHVDGEKAVWAEDNAYWALWVGEAYASTGVSSTPVYDGSTFRYVWTAADAG